MTLDDELVHVARLLRVEAAQGEVVHDEQVRRQQPTHGSLGGEVGAALVELPQQDVGAQEEHVVPRSTRRMSERAGEERLADADGAHEDDVLGAVDEAEPEQLADAVAVEGHLGVPVEALEGLLVLEARMLEPCGELLVIAPVDLVLQHQLEQLQLTQLLLAGVRDPVGERGQQPRQA